MAGSRVGYAMFVIYGYVAWVVAEYAWQWWKDRQQKRRQIDVSTTTGDQQGPSSEPDASTTPGP